MSGYDLGVWFSNVAMGRDQAADFLQHVLADWVVLQRHPSFDAFWIELLARFPGTSSGSEPLTGLDAPPISMISSLDKIELPALPRVGNANPLALPLDDMVWAQGPLTANGCVALLSVAWSRASEVVPQIMDLASHHGLTAYDTQSGNVTSPPGLVHGSGPESARLRLEVAGRVPALDIRILLDGQPIASFAAASRREAHSRARSAALEHGLPLYEVADPGSLAQGFASRPKPLLPDDPDLSEIGKFLLGFEGVRSLHPKPK